MMKELASPRLELMKRDVPAYQRCSFQDLTQRKAVKLSPRGLSLVLRGAFNATMMTLPIAAFFAWRGQAQGAPLGS